MSKLPQTVIDLRALLRALQLRKSSWSNGIEIPDQPAFDPEFEDLFREKINHTKYYLEFGSGASTVLAAKAGVETICVESDRKYVDLAAFDAMGWNLNFDVLANPDFAFNTNNIDVAAVPEPATWGMMIFGFGMVGGALRRRRKSVTAKPALA